MKTNLFWFVSVVVAGVLIFLGAHSWYSSHPKKVLVLIDTSYPMEARSFDVEDRLVQILRSRYAVFSVGDFTRPLKDFASNPSIPAFTFYGQRPDSGQIRFIIAQKAAATADQILILTNLKDSGSLNFDPRVEIVGLQPLLD